MINIVKKTFQIKNCNLENGLDKFFFFQFTGITHTILPHPRSMELANILSELLRNPGKGTLGV